MANTTAVATSQPTEIAIDNKFIDGLSSQLTKKQEFGLAFPSNYNVSNALNSAYLILQETTDRDKRPVLQTCSKQSIASALIDMTVQGLNPMKKQCYFVAYGGKLNLMRSYQGTMAVAKRAGAKKIVAEVIYEGDTFEYHIEDGVKVIDKHIQDFKSIDNSKIIGAYAVVTLEDYVYTEIMPMAQIEKAWSKGYGYKKGQGVHGDFTDQMAKKTVINRACKNVINSSDDGYLQEAFDNTSNNEGVDMAVEDMNHDIEENANKEEFVIPEEPQQVVEKKKEDKKPQKEKPKAKEEVIIDDSEPEWME